MYAQRDGLSRPATSTYSAADSGRIDYGLSRSQGHTIHDLSYDSRLSFFFACTYDLD
jgi:hypothetical protein